MIGHFEIQLKKTTGTFFGVCTCTILRVELESGYKKLVLSLLQIKTLKLDLKMGKLVFKIPKLDFKTPKLVLKTSKLLSPALSLQVLGWIPHKKFA